MAKLLVLKHLNKYASGVSLDEGIKRLGSVMITDATNFRHFRQETPEFSNTDLVVKPDMLFGKRGKHNLVLVKKDLDACEKWIYERMDQEVQVGHVKGKLTHFLIERFVPHKDEYYLALTTDREGTQIRFSVAGGIEVEENWEKVKTLSVPLLDDIDKTDLVRPSLPSTLFPLYFQPKSLFEAHNVGVKPPPHFCASPAPMPLLTFIYLSFLMCY